MVAHGFQIEVFQDIQHLDHMGPPGRGRRHGNDVVSPESPSNWDTGFRLAVDHVFFDHDTLVLLHVLDDFIGDGACIEPIHAFLSHLFHGIRQVGIGDFFPIGPRLSIMEIVVAEAFISIPIVLGFRSIGNAGIRKATIETFSGQIDGRGRNFFPVHGSIFLQDFIQRSV